MEDTLTFARGRPVTGNVELVERAAEVARLEDLITRGWRRLQEVRALGLPISEYPLSPERERRVTPP